MRCRILTLLSCGLLFLAAPSSRAREWSDSSGKFSVEAELLKNQGGQITLKKPDGSAIVVPIARLSEADRRYLESLEKFSGATVVGPTVSGKITGRDFSPDRIEFDGKTLTFRQGERYFRAVKIFLFLDERETPEGKTYNSTARKRFGARSPHVHVQWKEPGMRAVKTEMFIDDHATNLEFGSASEGKLLGKIDLRLPDEAQSFLGGTFTIAMPGETSLSGGSEISGKITVPAGSKGLHIWVGCLGRGPEERLEGPATGFKLGSSGTSFACTTWSPRNTSILRDKETNQLTHKHVARPPGRYLVYLCRHLPNANVSQEGYYDWKWLDIKDDHSKVTVDLTVDPGNLGTVEVTLSGVAKDTWVTCLPLDAAGQLPFPDAHYHTHRSSGAKIEGDNAIIRGLREGKYQVAMGRRSTPLPIAKANVEVTRGSTTKVELTPPPPTSP